MEIITGEITWRGVIHALCLPTFDVTGKNNRWTEHISPVPGTETFNCEKSRTYR